MDIATANALYRAGRTNDAEAAFSELVDGPDAAAASYGLGLLRLSRKQYAEAIEQFRHSFALARTAPVAYYLGTGYEATGAKSAALQCYRTAIELDSSTAVAHAAIARLTASAPEAAPTRTVADEMAAGETPTRGRVLISARPRLRNYLGTLKPGVALTIVLVGVRVAIRIAGSNVQALRALTIVSHLAVVCLEWLVPFLVASLFASWLTTRYIITDHRIEVWQGVLRRTQQALWLWEVDHPVEFRQSVTQQLFNTGTIVLQADSRTPAVSGELPLPGISTARHMRELAETLRLAVLRERRAMVNTFIGR